MKIVGVIPARYQSSRFPGKPLALIKGKPMIQWVYERASLCDLIDDLVVATDDQRIFDTCQILHMNVTMTGEHKTGADRVAEIASKTEGDIYLNIQGDEPLLDPRALNQIIDYMVLHPNEEYVGLRSHIGDEHMWSKPNCVKCVCDLNGYAIYFSRSPIPFKYNDNAVYRVMGFYGYKRKFLLDFLNYGQSILEINENGVEMLRAMEHGHKVKLIDTTYLTIGVDYPEHIAEVEAWMDK
jgi:3-deoxy-manno-octulosonate cytidylyltransferase (CMP-KDO synthetase)